MSERVFVAEEAAFVGDRSRVITEAAGNEIAVFRLDGGYYALANYCIHQGGPLCEGPVTGRITVDPDTWEWTVDEERYVECPWHTWQFDVTTGENTADPSYRVPTYPVEVENGNVYVLV